MTEPWRIELFGGLRAVQGDCVITRFRAHKYGALLAYLAYYRDRSHPREVLLDLFWPDLEPDAGRNNLSTTLSSLRHQLEPPGTPAGTVITADRFNVQLNAAAVYTDVAEFDSAIRDADKAGSDPIHSLQRAVDLHRGVLLPGFYEEWVITEQARWGDRFFQTARRLTGLLEQAGEFDRAIDIARRAVSMDALREEGHAGLIRLHALSGDRSAALRQYRELERILQEELGESPSAGIRGLVDLPRVAPAIARRAKAKPPEAARPVTKSSSGAPDRPLIRIPLQFTRFFGREEEIARLQKLLSSEFRDPSSEVSSRLTPHRLITLTGPGGSGKTRLAIEVAREAAKSFAGGIYFVPLADLSDPRLIPVAIAGVLGLPRSPDADPVDQIVGFFNHDQRPNDPTTQSPILLVLDNFEHLLARERRKSEDGAAVVRALLERIPALICLVTSRQQLDLEGEQDFAVLPLPTPTWSDGAVECWSDAEAHTPLLQHSNTPAELVKCASVALFVDRAQSLRPDFQVTPRNAADVAALCSRLEGIPLALELAAARAQVMTPGMMIAQLENRFEFLVSRRRDATDRHRTLRDAIEWSYRLLNAAHQRFFARLSVFRGGWTVEAAQAVCKEPQALEFLTHLCECSLVLTDDAGPEMRFRMLETLREFGQERVAPKDRDALRRLHASHFMSFAERAEPRLNVQESAIWLKKLESDYDNVRAALDWCKSDDSSHSVGLRLANAMTAFWIIRRHPLEALDYFEALLAKKTQDDELRARALCYAAHHAQQDPAVATAYYEQSIAISRRTGDRSMLVQALRGLGAKHLWRHEFSAAYDPLTQSLAVAKEIGDLTTVALALGSLGQLSWHRGEFAKSRAQFDEAISIARDLGDLWALGFLQRDHGMVASSQGDYPQSRDSYAASIRAFAAQAADAACAEVIWYQGVMEYSAGNIEPARELFAQSATVHEDSEERGARPARALLSMAFLERVSGNRSAARQTADGLLEYSRSRGLTTDAPDCLHLLGLVAVDDKDYGKARRLLADSIRLWRGQGDWWKVAYGLEGVAYLRAAQGHAEAAVRLFGAAAVKPAPIWGLSGIAQWRPTQREFEATLASVRRSLGEEAFQAAWAEGCAMTLDQAVAYAFEEDGE